ncbi:MAG: hypothetical protein M3Q75_04200 [Gemmatimonadota bacterium]|nr:hypothetical protein [Gemmatimonadota bacterium]
MAQPTEMNHAGQRLDPIVGAVDVRDSVTDASLVEGARGAVQVESRIDSLRPEPIYLFPDTVLVGGESEGIAEVRVERAGYAPWIAAGVRTRLVGDPCASWDTQALTARLQPE